MKKELFSVQDNVTGSFNAPFAAVNQNDACRMIQGACTPDTHIYKHADDYRLYYVGSFDQTSGDIQTAVPVLVMTVREIRDAAIRHQLEETSDEQA